MTPGLIQWIAWIAVGFSILYVLIQLRYLYHWNRIPALNPNDDHLKHMDGASIIIVAHNEQHSIHHCIASILSQDLTGLPFEIMVIDDHSTDQTVNVVHEIKDPRIKILALKDYPDFEHPPAFKKSGITLAVAKAKYPVIITTDADCVLPPTWLRTIMLSWKDPQMMLATAPVLLDTCNTLLEKMQGVEQLTLMLITGAGIHGKIHDMANGANMAFRKEAFLKVQGYEGNFHFASGDDMFLIEKIRASFPAGVTFIKSKAAAVRTSPKRDWSTLLQQRLRWAGKNKGLRSGVISRTWTVVGIYHILLVLAGIMALLQIMPWTLFLLMLLSKWIIDYVVISSASSFFDRKEMLPYFIPLQVMYAFYLLRLGLCMVSGQKGDWRR